MFKHFFRIAALVVVLASVPAPAHALSITTAAQNNGAGGAWLQLTAAQTTLYVTSFQTYFQSAAGTAVSVQVYHRPGTYVGFTGSATGWTLLGTINLTSAGNGALATITLPTPIVVAAGTTRGIYLQSITTNGGIRYNGTTALPPQTTYSNSDVILYSEHVKATTTAFGTPNTPRAFAGVVNYIRDPSAVGACCRPDGTCTSGTPSDCDAAPIGVWQFTGAACGTVVCPQPGACCAPENAACTFTAQFACASPNTFTAAGTTCSPNPCPAGACCKADGGCTSVTQTWCQTSGGTYTADSTACAAAGCPQPGACCLSNGGCQRLLSTACSALGGTASAPGVICASAGCWTAPILYHNGSIVTDPGAGFNGADASHAPAGSNIVGVSFNFATKVACEVIVPPGEVWTINKFQTVGYQTSAAITSNPYTALFVRVLDRDPRTPGATVLLGDLTTNVLDTANSPFANIYRMQSSFALTDVARPVFLLVATVPGFSVGAGTYWVEWSATNGATAFIPPVCTPLGMPYGTTIQSGAANNYVRLYDSTYQTATWGNNPGGFPHALPFVIEGVVGVGAACCQSNGTCIVTPGNPVVCASGTLNASATCNPNPCPQPQVGVCCLTDGTCSAATPGIPNASCAAGSLVVGGTCSPNTCPQPPAGVCCRGATCNTTVAQVDCLGAGTAGAVFTASAACNGAGVSTAPCCYPDYNKVDGVTVGDIFDFLNSWFSGSPFAAFGGDGAPAALAVQNIFDFLNAWFAGGC